MYDTRTFLRFFLPVLGIALVVVAGSYRLSESPGIWFDEGLLTQTAMNLAERGEMGLQIAPGTYVSAWEVSTGFPLIAPVAASYKFFGAGVTEGRAVMVLFLVALTLASYALVRRLFGEWVALASLFVLASYPVLYGNGKNVLGEVPGLLYLVLTLLALVRLERERFERPTTFFAVGIVAGLCVATKPLFTLLLPAIPLTMLVCRTHRALFFRSHFWKGVAAAALGFLPVMGLWMFMQFGSEGVSSILQFYTDPYGDTTQGGLWLIGNNVLRFVTELSPLYTAIFFGAWSLGLLLRYRSKESIPFAEGVAWFFSLLVLVFFVTMTPGWYRYFFPATVMAILFAPYNVWRVYEYVSASHAFVKRAWALPVLLVLLIGAQSYQLAANSWVASYYGGTRTQSLELYFSSFDAEKSVFLYNVPEVAIFLPTRQYYQYIKPEPLEIGTEVLGFLREGVPDVVIANTEAYRDRPEPFSRYRSVREVNRYTVLERL